MHSEGGAEDGMMIRQVDLVLIALGLLCLLGLSGCPEGFWAPGDGYGNDDGYPDGDGPPGQDDSLDHGSNTVISGEVIAIDRDTNVVLTPSQYDARAGGMLLYVLPSAQDISDVFAKVVLTEPGPYEVTLEGYVGPFEVMVVVDENRNQFIDAGDTAREFAFNPLTAAGNPIEDVNVYIDLPFSGLGGPPGGGGPDGLNGDPGDPDDDESVSNGCENTVISGDVNITDFPEGNVAVTTNSPDFAIGPREVYIQAGSGPFEAAECNSAEYTALLGYLDADNNGYFEPSDPIGEATGNPFVLGAGDVAGVQINIPADVEVLVPQPPLYVPITGSVAYTGFTTGYILDHASHISSGGILYSGATLAAPGPFSIIAPANTSNVLIWAVLDADGDGAYDVGLDPFDSVGPLDSGNGITQISLDLGSAPVLGEVGGIILYSGTTTANDVFRISIQQEMGDSMSQVSGLTTLGPTFPFVYNFDQIPTGSYWVSAQLDVGGDNPSFPPGSEDPVGSVGPYLLSPGGIIDTASFSVSISP
jgi:hypothetical protein